MTMYRNYCFVYIRNFISYFIKELIRLKMLIEFDPKEVAETLNEKNDYKYQDATKKINNLDSRKINKAIQNTHKIEKIINQYGYEVENAKRYLVSIKKLLEF